MLGLASENMLISDVKGELYLYTAPKLKELGYNVIALDFINFLKSNHYNFLDLVINAVEDDNIPLAESLVKLLEYVEPMEKKESWMEQIEGWKEEHPLRMKPKGDQMQAQDILETINEVFKEDDKIVVTDVGQHQMFTSQYLEVNEKTRLYMSGGLGTMGYGFPGAVGAQIGNPDSTVIAISGDGGMQMNIQEFATAVLEELPLILCVFNNTYLGMVRQWQKLFYGKRYSMTDLRAGAATRRGEEHPPKYTPDFVKLAESYGAKGIHVTEKSEMKAAFEQAKANRALKVPTLIEFMLDPEVQVYPMVRPGGTLEDLLMD